MLEIGSSDYDLLQKYWRFEPWGPWRDNMHMAILAREIRRSAFGFKNDPPLDNFFVMDPIEREQLELSKGIRAKKGIMEGMKALAGGMKKKASERPRIKVSTNKRRRNRVVSKGTKTL